MGTALCPRGLPRAEQPRKARRECAPLPEVPQLFFTHSGNLRLLHLLQALNDLLHLFGAIPQDLHIELEP